MKNTIKEIWQSDSMNVQKKMLKLEYDELMFVRIAMHTFNNKIKLGLGYKDN